MLEGSIVPVFLYLIIFLKHTKNLFLLSRISFKTLKYN